jgi:WD40 repeat protein
MTRQKGNSVDETVLVWDAETGLLKASLAGHTEEVDGAVFSPDGQLVASVSWDMTVKLWNASSGEVLQTLTGHTKWGKNVAFSSNGTKIASDDFGETVLIWGIERP